MNIKHLKKAKEFKEIYSLGKTVQASKLKAKFLETEGNDTISIGLTITKTCSKKATERNRIKRIMYAFFRESPRPGKQGKKIVIIANRKVGDTKKETYESIIEDLKKIKGKIWKN